MNQTLQTIQDLLQQNGQLTEVEKELFQNAITDADKQWSIMEFKLDRTEKVKRTTAILLEETIKELEQKRKAVEEQNRELEIETSLERVRAVAMSMNKPDDMLHVCRIISEQLEMLDVKEIRNAQTAIIYEPKGTYSNYEFYARHDKTFITEVDYKHHDLQKAFANQMLKGAEELFSQTLQGKELHDWYAYQKTTNQFVDVFLEKAPSLNYYWYSLGAVALGISTYSPLNEDEINLFKRFRNVFELAYRRFIDIEQAVEQAKEAKVEAALEKVRSRSLAMHKTDELQQVVSVVFEKLQELDVVMGTGGAIICTYIPNSKDVIHWIASPGFSFSESYKLPYFDHPIFIDTWASKDSKEGFFSKAYSSEEKNSFFEYLFAYSDYKRFPGEFKNWILSTKQFTLSAAWQKNSAIIIPSHTNILPSEKERALLKRFSKVFEQAYIRFLDLQKAEAQAREAQIELGLERVRARAMAMHKSDELLAAGELLYRELSKLGIESMTCGYVLMDEEEKYGWIYAASPADGTLLPKPTGLPHESEVMSSIKASWKKQEPFHVVELGPQATIEHHTYLAKNSKNFLFTLEEFLAISPEGIVMHSFNFKQGYLLVVSLVRLTPAQEEMLLRFTKVFEMTYRRFLDLQKAEAQAREATIEAALERVRSRSMAMHKSEEVMGVAVSLYDELQKLNFTFGATSAATVIIMDEKTGNMEHWLAGFIKKNHVESYEVNNIEYPIHAAQLAAWRAGKKFISIELSGTALKEYAQEMFTQTGYRNLPDEEKAMLSAQEHVVFNLAYMSHGALMWAPSALSDENAIILQRFAKVFEQTYTRFLDLQKVEAQSREAQIQLALERVRARTMAMQKSDELTDVAAVLFQQVAELGITAWTTGFNVWSEDNNYYTDYITSPSGGFIEPYTIAATSFPAFKEISDARKRGEAFYVFYLEGEMLKQTYQELCKFGDQKQYEKMLEGGFEFPACQFNHFVFGAKVSLMFITYEPAPEAHAIFMQFGKVFEQTYTRFLDLQKAEAQATEAKIEAALERIRSRTMAMQRSDELAEVAFVFYQQFKEMAEVPEGMAIAVLDNEQAAFEFWMTGAGGAQIADKFKAAVEEPIMFGKAYDAWNEQQKSLIIDISGDDFSKFINYLNSIGFPVDDRPFISRAVNSCAFFSRGFIAVTTLDFLPNETARLLERFTSVFDLTYTRFLDLQKAEAQVREAQIELGLERVRARAMAMQKSEESKELIGTVFTELTKLDLTLTRCVLMIYDAKTLGATWWMANSEDSSNPTGLFVKHHQHPPQLAYIKAWQERMLKWHYILEGKIKTDWDDFIFSETELSRLPDFVIAGMKAPERVYLNVSFNNFGNLTLASLEPLSNEHFDILLRFAKVFDLTYTRFNDLKQAEASAKDAVKQAALDRIRADIASMRTTADLERITPLIWNELTILGIPFIRCGVFLMDDPHELIHTFLSTPNGKAIAAFHLPYTAKGNISHVLNNWRNKKNYIDHWDEAAFTEFAGTLVKEGAITSPQSYLKTLPHGGFYLHFLPFLQGMLYVGNTTLLEEGEINLIQSVAEAFSTAYARYEDFKKLEAAKQQVDITLTELKAAQAQLIQSEKMASLGELTAGIAHEIQNPLNFVNNFSETNVELIEEAQEELKARNLDEALSILNDVKENESKINHHGKRADAIVKNMLQHSRTNTGKKEPTDINALTDEYLRLSYHGLRAKDKSFNATIETHFDESISKINIIPQDMGRVLLNLFNNAFYAVNEQKKKLGAGYEPAISVSTTKLDDTIAIQVADNGMGILKSLQGKIFQPFFTTKPTGQGTGLGLSLSYDIIKAHGGELKVESNEGKGATFTVTLPA